MNEKKARRKIFFAYVIPSIGAMLVTSLYVVVDGIFVGQGVGHNALGAINIAGPFIMVVVALAMMVTVGGATLSAISLARKEDEKASRYFTISMLLIVVIAALMTLITSIWPEQIVRFLGADDILAEESACYLKYFVMFCVFFCSSSALAAFVRNDGSPNLSFIGMVIGGVSNIFLDWLFIFPLDMGIKGSAIASGLGQILSCAILISHFFMKKSRLKLSLKGFKGGDIVEICKRGTPEFMNQLFQPITVLCYNLLAMKVFGSIGVDAFSIVYYVLTITVAVFVGLTQGTQPLISTAYGENDEEGRKYFFRLGAVVNLALAVLVYVIVALLGKQIIWCFNDNKELIEIGYKCMLIYGISFIPTSLMIVIISDYTAKKQTAKALILSSIRCLVLIPLFVFVTPMMFGDSTLWLGITIAEIVALLIAIIIEKIFNKVAKNKELKSE